MPQTTIDPITSDQTGVHPDLAIVVRRHMANEWRKPVPEHTRRAADELLAWIATLPGRPIILDSFCGTGMSTAQLARRHPDCVVIGIDKSADRLSRHASTPAEEQVGCYRLVRAECEPLWRCLIEAGITLQQHCLYYPNPWPKGSHFKRRIHGHPAFPLLLELGGTLELRTNWELYAQEFVQAAELLGFEAELTRLEPDAPITLFERKYHERGQSLWRVDATPRA